MLTLEAGSGYEQRMFVAYCVLHALLYVLCARVCVCARMLSLEG